MLVQRIIINHALFFFSFMHVWGGTLRWFDCMALNFRSDTVVGQQLITAGLQVGDFTSKRGHSIRRQKKKERKKGTKL